MMRRIILPVLVLIILGLAACEKYRIVLPSVSKDVQGDTPVSSEPGSGDNPMTASPLEPLANEDQMTRGEVLINESSVLTLESYPLQIVLTLKGTLPTPCHYLRAKVATPDDQKRIQVEVYSLSEPDTICIQVLQVFETRINLGSYPDGTYTILVNGEAVGEFTQ